MVSSNVNIELLINGTAIPTEIIELRAAAIKPPLKKYRPTIPAVFLIS